MVPVEDCIATTGAMTGKGCGGVGGGGIGDGVWGAVKEGSFHLQRLIDRKPYINRNSYINFPYKFLYSS